MDVLSLLNEKVFLGQEFLTWLWFQSETRGQVELEGAPPVLLMVGDRLVLGPVQGREGTRVTVSGQESSLAEAREALRRGKLLESLRIGLEIEGDEFWCTLRAADLAVTGLRLPPTAPGEDGMDGLILERVALGEAAVRCVDRLFQTYLGQRLASGHGHELLESMTAWAREGA